MFSKFTFGYIYSIMTSEYISILVDVIKIKSEENISGIEETKGTIVSVFPTHSFIYSHSNIIII